MRNSVDLNTLPWGRTYRYDKAPASIPVLCYFGDFIPSQTQHLLVQLLDYESTFRSNNNISINADL